MRKFILSIALLITYVEAASAKDIFVGKYQARGILSVVEKKNGKSPMVVLFPGSGAMGPEVRFPGFFIKSDGQKRLVTTDGVSHSIFEGFTAALNEAGVSTLAIGKPGVDFSAPDVYPPPFYDQSLYQSLTWYDWVETAREAVAFARTLSEVDPDRIYVLGHSESTQMVADYAITDSRLAGVILLGVLNDSFATGDAYQIFEADADLFVSRTVDANHDGFIEKSEATLWPNDFSWTWDKGQTRVSIAEIKVARKNDPRLQAQYKNAKSKFREAVYDRPSTLAEILVPLGMSLFVFTGELDVMTVPAQAEAVDGVCKKAAKKNCEVLIVPGLGHGFSAPIAPRSEPFLDWSFGPVAPEFQNLLKKLGQRL